MSETNYVARGERVTISAELLNGPNDPIKGGDPVLIGRLCGVAVADETPGSAGPFNDGNVVVQLVGVFNLSVKSQQEAGINIGETVYFTQAAADGTGAILSDDYTQTPFGTALAAVTLGSTTVIPVRLFGATFGVIGAGS
jgi:predicted RecA/RadA family phage recombinase